MKFFKSPGAWINMVGLIIIALLLLSFARSLPADEPIVATEFEYENDSITVGVIGDDPLSLYTQGDSTIGIAGDTVISIDRSYRPRLDIEVEPDLFSEEDIRYPLEERRD